MAVSKISNYSNSLYLWQNQQLKSNSKGSSSASSSASSMLTNLLSGQSMASQISSMVELTKYAMDAMGLSSDSRVTFTQISRYRQQLQSEFSQGVKNGLASSGISNLAGLSFSLGKDGKISAIGANEADRKAAQAWLDGNPSLGEDLRAAISASAVESTDKINFTISSTGKMTLVDTTSKNYQALLDGKAELTANLRGALAEMGVTSYPLDLSFGEDGVLQAAGDNPHAEAINAWLAEHSDIADTVKKQMETDGIHYSSATLRLGGEGNIQISINNAENNEIQSVLADSTEIGKKIYSSLDNLGIDPNIQFAIQLNDDGTIEVISDHPDKDKLSAFFANNPELVKKYSQIEALAGIDDARKAMRLAPSAMRKRIQIESMASWWVDSGNSNSYFGQYSDGSMSLLAGLNINV